MPDKEQEIPVKVVDRRWWARQGQESTDTTPVEPSLKPTYVEELEQKLADKDRQLQDAIARYRKAAAEFDESRIRQRREISKEIERGRREILADLLDVLDNLDRAVEAARSNTSAGALESLVQGVDMVRQQFLAKLESFGVTRMKTEGQRFDPQLHEAVTTVPASSSDDDGRIVGVVRHGYRIGDEVLRPAAVAVGKVGAESPA